MGSWFHTGVLVRSVLLTQLRGLLVSHDVLVRSMLPQLRGPLVSHRCFGEVHVAHYFGFLCCVFVMFVLVLCLVCPMLPVSLGCPFLIAPSVFNNVYLPKNINVFRQILYKAGLYLKIAENRMHNRKRFIV